MSGRQPAFTLVELMVTVSVLSILAGITIQVSGNEWRRERVNAAVVELSGWLEAVRSSSNRGDPCTVTLYSGSALGGGAQLASAATAAGITNPIANNCLSVSPALLPSVTTNVTFTVAASPSSFTFTPRGTVFPEPAPDAPIEVTVKLNDGGPARRLCMCALLGLVEIVRFEDTCQCADP